MPTSNIKKATKLLGKKNIDCFEDIFSKLDGQPARLLRERYRASNPALMETLDSLEHQQLLKTDDMRQHYWLSVYTLPLLENQKAVSSIKTMNEIFQILKSWHGEHLKKPLPVVEIINASKYSEEETLQALYYMIQAHNVWGGLSRDFPYKKESTITLSERILLYDEFLAILSEYWQWQLARLQHASPLKIMLVSAWANIKRLPVVIWRDPVISAVIAAGIITLLTILSK